MENIFDNLDLRIFLGLGSNEGDREKNLRTAVGQIKRLGLEVVKASSIYETEPVGHKKQDWFLNQVVEVKFGQEINLPIDERRQKDILANRDRNHAWMLISEELLITLLEIEKQMGRERTFPNAPRVIDIDLLLFNQFVYSHYFSASLDKRRRESLASSVVIPHPRMHFRRFVLEPLCEIAPDFIHPKLGKSITEILAALGDDSIVRLYRS